MENYYFHDGRQKFGPFSLDEMKAKVISRTTQVWREGMKEWVKASELEELKSSFEKVPPPFTKLPDKEERTHKLVKNMAWISLTAIVFVFGTMFYNRYQSLRNSLPPSAFVDPEHTRPAAYINATGTYRPNFWRTKWELNINVANNASHTNYKDVMIRVNFISGTNTVIDSKVYTFYDLFPYGTKKDLTLEVEKPALAVTCGWGVIEGTVY